LNQYNIKIKNKEAVVKVLVWRVFISIPISTAVTYLYYGELFNATKFVLMINIIMTVSHFIFEKIYPAISYKIFRNKDI
jgi:uncharacterized membrane protein